MFEKWIADECVGANLVRRLRQAGYDVLYIAESEPGISDAAVIEIARSENRIVLTEDKDFGELVFRKHHAVPGLVLLRIEPEDRQHTWERFRSAIEHWKDELGGRFIVITLRHVRSRPLTED